MKKNWWKIRSWFSNTFCIVSKYFPGCLLKQLSNSFNLSYYFHVNDFWFEGNKVNSNTLYGFFDMRITTSLRDFRTPWKLSICRRLNLLQYLQNIYIYFLSYISLGTVYPSYTSNDVKSILLTVRNINNKKSFID